MPLRITECNANFEEEPLASPFGFKGGYLSRIWQSAVRLSSDCGLDAWGVGCQSVLWSEPRLFTSLSESGGNALMFLLTDLASHLAREIPFETPLDLMNQLLDPLVYEARRISGLEDIRKTFLLNALVPLDNAAWMLYAAHHGISDFDRMIPEPYRPYLSERHSRVASVPVSSWSMPADRVEKLMREEGYFVIKFKLGAPGNQEEMLRHDMERLKEVHDRIGECETAHTENGRIPYYLDLNGRYNSVDCVRRLLDYARKIGAFDRIMLLEEPFPETLETDVRDLGVRVVADESAHSAVDVETRIEMGYGAIALKPIAKTLSGTLQMLRVASEMQVPCFCADLTVNPLLTDWNKNVAARLPALPGLTTGLLEVNGHQNYRYWYRMKSYHPNPDASWLDARNGVFELNREFYRTGGGIFGESEHYRTLASGRL